MEPIIIDAQFRVVDHHPPLFRQYTDVQGLRVTFAVNNRIDPFWSKHITDFSLGQGTFVPFVYRRPWWQRGLLWLRSHFKDILATIGLALLCLLFAGIATLAILATP